jgi:hypothetical protein
MSNEKPIIFPDWEADFRFDIDSEAHFKLGVKGMVELKLSIPIGAITESVTRALH